MRLRYTSGYSDDISVSLGNVRGNNVGSGCQIGTALPDDVSVTLFLQTLLKEYRQQI